MQKPRAWDNKVLVTVKRVNFSDYEAKVESMGDKASYVYVPSTNGIAAFTGVYSDALQHEAIVAWPVDRPQVDQDLFAVKHMCGYPVEVFKVEEEKKNEIIVL